MRAMNLRREWMIDVSIIAEHTSTKNLEYIFLVPHIVPLASIPASISRPPCINSSANSDVCMRRRCGNGLGMGKVWLG